MAGRSAADATRFTATAPHAYSQPTSIHSSTISQSTSNSQPLSESISKSTTHTNSPPKANGSQPPPRTETPQEKVARLRAARLAQRSQTLTPWQRTVIRGRVWADRAHKLTTLSLVGFSVVIVSVTAFTFTDMIIHNRRKRAAFTQEQHAIYQARVVAAIEIEKAGLPLDQDSLLVLARERAKLRAEERKKERGWLKGLGARMTGGFKKDMEPIVVPTEGQMLDKLGVNNFGVLEASEGKARVNDKGDIEGAEESELAKAIKLKRQKMGLEESRRPTELTGTGMGGMLDRIGERAIADLTADKSSSQSSWLNWGK